MTIRSRIIILFITISYVVQHGASDVFLVCTIFITKYARANLTNLLGNITKYIYEYVLHAKSVSCSTRCDCNF